MKKALLLFLLFLAPLAAAHPVFAPHSRDVGSAVDAVSRLPEARPLLDKVEKEGKVTVTGSSRFGNQFSAFWDGARREICIPNASQKSRGQVITSVVFELHNARAHRQIAQLDQKALKGQISKAAYVEALERIEHKNAVDAMALLNKGVKAGLFPADAKWDMPKHFDTYFKVQKESGHSAWIARKYDGMSPIARTT